MVLWLKVGPATKPSHQEAITANTLTPPALAGSFNPKNQIKLIGLDPRPVLFKGRCCFSAVLSQSEDKIIRPVLLCKCI